MIPNWTLHGCNVTTTTQLPDYTRTPAIPYMFWGADEFNQPLGGRAIERVISMQEMIGYPYPFNHINSSHLGLQYTRGLGVMQFREVPNGGCIAEDPVEKSL